MQIVIETDNGYQIEVVCRKHMDNPKYTEAADLPAKDVKAISKAIKKAVEDNKE